MKKINMIIWISLLIHFHSIILCQVDLQNDFELYHFEIASDIIVNENFRSKFKIDSIDIIKHLDYCRFMVSSREFNKNRFIKKANDLGIVFSDCTFLHEISRKNDSIYVISYFDENSEIIKNEGRYEYDDYYHCPILRHYIIFRSSENSEHFLRIEFVNINGIWILQAIIKDKNWTRN